MGHQQFVNMVDLAQLSKEELVIELQRVREQISKEAVNNEQLQQKVAGQRIFAAILRWLFERKLRKKDDEVALRGGGEDLSLLVRLQAVEEEKKVVEEEASRLRIGLTKVLEHAQKHRRSGTRGS